MFWEAMQEKAILQSIQSFCASVGDRSILYSLPTKQRNSHADVPNVKDTAHTLKVFARPHLDNRQFEKGIKELDRLTSKFPSVMMEVNRHRGRGFGL